MQIILVLFIVLTGLSSVYLWRENKKLLRRTARLAKENSTQESSRRYKEIFDNGSDAVFVVEVESREKFCFESLNPPAVQAICPQGPDLCGYRFDETAPGRKNGGGKNAGLARLLSELAVHLRRCVSSGLPADYESVFDVSADGGVKNYHLKLIPMADDDGISHIICFAQDITARKLYEQELLERIKLEERLSGFATSAPGFLYTYRHGADGSNNMTFASAGISELFGLCPEDVAGSIAQMNLRIHPDDMSGFIAATAASAANLTPLAIEFRVQHPAKGELWVESRSMPVLDAEGNINWHGFMHDITARKLSDQRLREAHEFTDGIVNAIPDIIIVKDRQHRWLMINDACCEMMGQPREKLLGKSESDFFPKENADMCWAGDERVFTTGLADINVETMTSENGETLYLQAKKTLYREDGDEYLIAVIRDISESKRYEQTLLERSELEQRQSQFFNVAPGFFYTQVSRPDGGYAMPFASIGIRDLFGLEPENVAQDFTPLAGMAHPDDAGMLFQMYEVSARNLTPLHVEYRIFHPEKGMRWLEQHSLPQRTDAGEVRWDGFMHDITERKKMEDSLRYSRENLAEAQRIGRMGSWELDLESGALSWTDEIYRIFEIDPNLFGATYDAFLNAIHPDDRDAVSCAYAESLETGAPYSIEHRLLFADGRIKHVRECCETHYAENGKPLHSHGTVQDITALKETERQLKETQDKLRELISSRESLIEGEHKRIAWEMHEELGQLLAAMKMRLYGMRTQLPKNLPALAEDSRVILTLIDKSIKTVHEVVSGLRPTILLHGTVAALEWLVAEFNKYHGISCELEVDEDGTLASDELTTLVFRIVRESLDNIARHPGVSCVNISWLSKRSGHCLTIWHDGESFGIDFSGESSLSFFGMKERVTAFGGEMQIFHALEHGTSIETRFPVREVRELQLA